MARLSRWWRATVSYRGRILESRRLRGDAPIVLGPGGDVDFVMPGLDVATVVARDGSIAVAEGVPLALEASEGDAVRVRPTAHPDVCLELRAESGEPVSMGGRWPLPTRELAYGLALAGCIVALLAVEHHAAAMDAGTRTSDPGHIERVMMSAAPVRFESPPAPVLPRPPVEPPSDLGFEPVHVTPGERGGLGFMPLEPVPTREVVETGVHSHSAPGLPSPAGLGEGPAAEPTAFVCEDPKASPKSNVDVVFVIDVSTTMSFMLRHLSEEIAALDRVVRRHDEAPRYGLVVFVDDVLVANGGQAYVDVDALRRDFEHWAAFTSSNRQLRSELLNLDWPENSLDALHAAATGFDWRPADDTLRLVVHATDDTFGDGGHWLSGGQVRHGYAETVQALQDARVRVATFAARIGGRCECENVEAGFFTPYRDQPSIPDATGGAVFDIDEVASRRLRFATAVTALVDATVCD